MSTSDNPFLSINQQIAHLEKQGLIIRDKEDAYEKLQKHNYYTVINGYRYPFLQKDTDGRTAYLPGTTFDEIFALYSFDCKFRALLLEYILKIEHQLKSIVAHYFAQIHSEEAYPAYLDRKNFDIRKDGTLPPKKETNYTKFRKSLDDELSKQEKKNNRILMPFRKSIGDEITYDYTEIKPWVLVSFFSFGMLSYFYSCLNKKDQNAISRIFKLQPGELEDYLRTLNPYRNSCAHDEIIYRKPLLNPVIRKDRNNDKKEYRKVYVIILILKDLLDASAFMSFYAKLDDYLIELERNLQIIPIDNILKAMGMPADKAVRKNDLGPLERGNALSEEEFEKVLSRYILPTLPITTKLEAISPEDPLKSNKQSKLVYCSPKNEDSDTLYFAQAVDGPFSYYVKLRKDSVSQEQIAATGNHLAVLIDYIHIFWNLSNLTAYGRDKVSIAFPTLCEQAYELAICNLLCTKDTREQSVQLKQEHVEYKRHWNQPSREERKLLMAQYDAKQDAHNKDIALTGIAEKTLYGVLVQLETWAAKTYEGQKKAFGIIICTDQLSEKNTFDYIHFLKSDYSATINDGLYSAVELYTDGFFKEHLTIHNSTEEQIPSIPYPFNGFANLCTKSKIGILLTETGDILIINDQKLCYTKHNGNWLCNMSEKAIQEIDRELPGITTQQAEVIYQAVVDVSYSRGGACIGIVNEDDLPEKLNEMIKAGLLISTEPSEKLCALRNMVSVQTEQGIRQKSFFELDRALRRELLELDGAMVLSSSGYIHAIGTIIKLDGSGSDGGGRTAAAKQLSCYGLAIKVSQDGYVKLYRNQNAILEILT